MKSAVILLVLVGVLQNSYSGENEKKGVLSQEAKIQEHRKQESSIIKAREAQAKWRSYENSAQLAVQADKKLNFFQVTRVKLAAAWEHINLKFIQDFYNQVTARISSFFSSFQKNEGRVAPIISSTIYEKLTSGPSPRIKFIVNYSDADNDVEKIVMNYGDGKIVTYENGEFSNPFIVEHIYERSEHYNVSVSIEDSASNTVSQSFYTEIAGDETPKSKYFAEADALNNLKINFDVVSDNVEPESVDTWFTGCPSGGTALKTFNCTFPSAGTYPIALFSKDTDKGIEFFESEIIVGGSVVKFKPVSKIEADYEYGAAPLVVNFDAGKSFNTNGEIVSYEWDFGDYDGLSNYASGSRATKTFYYPGIYFVKLKIKNSDGLESTAYKQIAVYDTYNRNPEIALYNTGVRQVSSDSSNYFFPFPDESSYVFWDMGDGTKYQGRGIQHTYATAGTYTVSLKVISLEGNVYTKSKTVTISNTIDEPNVVLGVNTKKVVPFEAASFDASLSTDPLLGSLTFKWIHGDGSIGSSLAYDYKAYDSLGIFPTELLVTNSRGLSKKARVNMEVVSDYNAIMAQVIFSPKIGVAPMTVTLDAKNSYSNSAKIKKHEWKINGAHVSQNSSLSKTFTTAGNYFFEYLVTDEMGNL